MTVKMVWWCSNRSKKSSSAAPHTTCWTKMARLSSDQAHARFTKYKAVSDQGLTVLDRRPYLRLKCIKKLNWEVFMRE